MAKPAGRFESCCGGFCGAKAFESCCEGFENFKACPKRATRQFRGPIETALGPIGRHHAPWQFFFSVQRLHGFRQVVTHIQSQQKDELKLSCKAVYLSIATKVLVVNLYAVQRAVPARNQTKKHNQKQKKPNKQKNTTTTKPKTNKTPRSGIATSNGNNMHDNILYVIMRMAKGGTMAKQAGRSESCAVLRPSKAAGLGF